MGCTLLKAGVVLGLIFLSACEKDGPDQEEIRGLVDRIDDANQNRNGEAAAASFTASSIARYPRLIKLALDGQRRQIEALDAWDMSEVLLMRTMARRKDIKDLDGRAYVVFATGRGWYRQDDPPTVELRSIRILRGGNEALARAIYNGDTDTAETLRFAREDGVWKLDEESWRPSFNQYIRERAADDGISIVEAILQEIEEQTGTTPPATIWNPMR